jgi:hypothetical protein
VILLWREPPAGGVSTVRSALNGALTSMVKAVALDLAPRFVAVNGVAVPADSAVISPGAFAATLQLLTSPRLSSMIGQILRPVTAPPTPAVSWGSW